MAKVSKNVMEQFIKGLSTDNSGNIEVPSSIMRGMFHVIIKDEVFKYLKEHYTEPIKIKDIEINKIANALQRNSAQVGYYLREIKDDGAIEIERTFNNSATSRVVTKIKKYFLDLGENNPTSIYDVAQAIEENVSTIYAVSGNTDALCFNHKKCGYDDRGRTARKIWLSDYAWSDALNLM